MLDLDGLLRFAVEHGASDVHVKVGSRPRLRVDGRLREAPFDTVEPADTERVAAAVIPGSRAETFAADHECDFTYGIAGPRAVPGERVPPAGLDRLRAAPGAAGDPQLRRARRCPPAVATLAERSSTASCS